MPPDRLGFTVEALRWIQVDPASLHEAVQAAATHQQVAFAAATSGTTNLLLAVGCRDTSELYEYLAGELSDIPGVRTVQTVVVLRTIKRAGTLLETVTTQP